jgi:large subunit ribosomal protein L19e
MNLLKKKELAKKTLGVGKSRICFDSDRIKEIKEAITKQDIKDLHAEGAITIKPVKGRKTIKRRKTKRGPGKIKKTINKRKQIYVTITRKLRDYIKALKLQGKISNESYIEIRKKIRMRVFRGKAHLKEYLKNVEKIKIGAEALLKPETKSKGKRK